MIPPTKQERDSSVGEARIQFSGVHSKSGFKQRTIINKPKNREVREPDLYPGIKFNNKICKAVVMLIGCFFITLVVQLILAHLLPHQISTKRMFQLLTQILPWAYIFYRLKLGISCPNIF